jgi:hypothetical protein
MQLGETGSGRGHDGLSQIFTRAVSPQTIRADIGGSRRRRQCAIFRGLPQPRNAGKGRIAMHVSIRRYRNVSSVAEVSRRIGESFVPLLKQSPGFIAYYVVDGGSGTMATISMFSTEMMALESNETAAAWLKKNVADLQPEPPEITAGVVRIKVTA